MKVALGGDRLGSGNNMDVQMQGYERSTHDVGNIMRTTMAAGTLVPSWSQILTAGSSLDMDLQAEILTHPTVGPLFGSYKYQRDVFIAPIRLFQGKLSMDLLNVGRNMASVFLPQVTIEAAVNNRDGQNYWEREQINPSAIFSYLNIRGVGYNMNNDETEFIARDFNAVTWLMYWDIYKNYYANKQENIGVVIHNNLTGSNYETIAGVTWKNYEGAVVIGEAQTVEPPLSSRRLTQDATIEIEFTGMTEFDETSFYISYDLQNFARAIEIFSEYELDEDAQTVTFSRPMSSRYVSLNGTIFLKAYNIKVNADMNDVKPRLRTFPLENIDKQRINILKAVDAVTPFTISRTVNNLEPYSLALKKGELNGDPTQPLYSAESNQEGLGIKTYQSDLFNNWMDTETIDGSNGVNEVTRIDTTKGYIEVDEIILAKKVFNMLNRTNVGDGSYSAWQEATYDHKQTRNVTSSVYVGGMSREITFQEVISNSASEEQPLGTLAGRGHFGGKGKGGRVKIGAVNEASYVMVIDSITPRIGYSQGNKWDVNLKTMDDLHKPELDQMGWQDLNTEQMHYLSRGANEFKNVSEIQSAGKQPAWINWTTNVDYNRGNFALEDNEMFMVLDRRYEIEKNPSQQQWRIRDLTTYIDPSKYNFTFADLQLDAQNFWVHTRTDAELRAKMSAKQIPTL